MGCCGWPLAFRGISIFRRTKPSILKKNNSVGKKRQVKQRDREMCEHVCFGIKCAGWIWSNKAPALLHPTFPVPHTYTNTRTTTLSSHLHLARFGPGPCLQAAPVPRFPAPSRWPSTQPQPPSAGRQAKWLELLSGAKSPDCHRLCCFCIVIITDGM